MSNICSSTMLPWLDREPPSAIFQERRAGGGTLLSGRVLLARFSGETSIMRIENPSWVTLPATGESSVTWLYIASVKLMSRRLAAM
jgi:hypothetical protein